MCEGDDGSVGRPEFVKFVEFILSIESIMLLAPPKIDVGLYEKLPTKGNVRSKLNSSILALT